MENYEMEDGTNVKKNCIFWPVSNYEGSNAASTKIHEFLQKKVQLLVKSCELRPWWK